MRRRALAGEDSLKKLDFAQTVGLLANLGVIAGILFLAAEVRQNNEYMAAEARFNRLSVHTASAALVVENPELVESMVRSFNGEELTLADTFRLQAHWFRVMQNINWTYFEAFEEAPLETWKVTFRYPFVRGIWEERKVELDPEFVQFVEANILDR